MFGEFQSAIELMSPPFHFQTIFELCQQSILRCHVLEPSPLVFRKRHLEENDTNISSSNDLVEVSPGTKVDDL